MMGFEAELFGVQIGVELPVMVRLEVARFGEADGTVRAHFTGSDVPGFVSEDIALWRVSN